MSEIHAPEQPLPRRYLQSILFLADRMSESDGKAAARQRLMIEDLAEAAKMKGFKNDKSYRQLNNIRACSMLDIEEAKEAALVVMALVMKADHVKREEELAYFHKIREMLKCDPITVPADIHAHKDLALKYLG